MGDRLWARVTYTITVCNQPTRSTQSCIPPGSLNRAPASAGVKAGMSPLQVTLCDPIWHVSSRSGVATSVSELLYPCYFTLLYTHSHGIGAYGCRYQHHQQRHRRHHLSTSIIAIYYFHATRMPTASTAGRLKYMAVGYWWNAKLAKTAMSVAKTPKVISATFDVAWLESEPNFVRRRPVLLRCVYRAAGKF